MEKHTQKHIAKTLGVTESEISVAKNKHGIKPTLDSMQRHFNAKKKRGRATHFIPTGKFEDTETWEDRERFARGFAWRQRQALQAAQDDGQVGELVTLMKALDAAENRVSEVESRATEAQLKGGHLVSTEAVRTMIAQLLRPLRQALDKLPVNERTNCNPEHPEIAERALKEWRDRLLLRANAALDAFGHAENGEYIPVPAKGKA
jgi:hypothetical protein